MYKYKLRPGYGSDKLLIETSFNGSSKNIIKDLFQTLAEMAVAIDKTEDLWMNDEILYHLKSNHGNFLLSIDVWNSAFIMCNDNQELITEIDRILNSSKVFEKIEVDFEDYKLK